jgi:hypothetical protein
MLSKGDLLLSTDDGEAHLKIEKKISGGRQIKRRTKPVFGKFFGAGLESPT